MEQSLIPILIREISRNNYITKQEMAACVVRDEKLKVKISPLLLFK